MRVNVDLSCLDRTIYARQFWGAKPPIQFRYRWAERNHSDHYTDSEPLPNSLMSSAMLKSANLPVFTSLVWRCRGWNPGLPHPKRNHYATRGRFRRMGHLFNNLNYHVQFCRQAECQGKRSSRTCPSLLWNLCWNKSMIGDFIDLKQLTIVDVNSSKIHEPRAFLFIFIICWGWVGMGWGGGHKSVLCDFVKWCARPYMLHTTAQLKRQISKPCNVCVVIIVSVLVSCLLYACTQAA